MEAAEIQQVVRDAIAGYKQPTPEQYAAELIAAENRRNDIERKLYTMAAENQRSRSAAEYRP
jgi:hypothetical protein